MKSEDVYEDTAGNVGQRFDTLNYEVERAVPIGKNKKVIIVMKDELGGKRMKEFVGL